MCQPEARLAQSDEASVSPWRSTAGESERQRETCATCKQVGDGQSWVSEVALEQSGRGSKGCRVEDVLWRLKDGRHGRGG